MKAIILAIALSFGVATSANAAGWLAIKWAQCYRLGGAYCR